MEEKVSLLDEYLADQPAQLASSEGMPTKKWANVKTTLSDIDSRKIHYVKVPENHVVIDFDLKDQNGHKGSGAKSGSGFAVGLLLMRRSASRVRGFISTIPTTGDVSRTLTGVCRRN